jgi:ribulose-phosphate 3-epimerase
MVKISPSILSSDYSILGDELKRMQDCGADMLHIDVMDGHFVPNITLGAPIVRCIRKCSTLPFDVHLMISDPYKYVPDFVRAGSDIITFHIEADSDIEKTIELINSLGVKAGLAVKPKTPVEEVFPYLDKLAMVLVMTVEPGFGGQSFMADMMPKVSAVRAEIERRGDPLALPFEQRKRNVIESVKAGLRKNPEVYDEYGERLNEAVEVIMPALFDLWK